jgi:hypothetical protein
MHKGLRRALLLRGLVESGVCQSHAAAVRTWESLSPVDAAASWRFGLDWHDWERSLAEADQAILKGLGLV